MRQTEKLLQGLKWRCIRGELPREVTQVAYDSRNVEPGGLFVCIRGSRQDGHAFIREAVERGAAAILTEKDVIDEEKLITCEKSVCWKLRIPELHWLLFHVNGLIIHRKI